MATWIDGRPVYRTRNPEVIYGEMVHALATSDTDENVRALVAEFIEAMNDHEMVLYAP